MHVYLKCCITHTHTKYKGFYVYISRVVLTKDEQNEGIYSNILMFLVFCSYTCTSIFEMLQKTQTHKNEEITAYTQYYAMVGIDCRKVSCNVFILHFLYSITSSSSFSVLFSPVMGY